MKICVVESDGSRVKSEGVPFSEWENLCRNEIKSIAKDTYYYMYDKYVWGWKWIL